MIYCKDTGEHCQTYKEYLQSEHWKLKRLEFASVNDYICSDNDCTCSVQLHIHHKSYKRLGAELLTDLAYLCESHHYNGRHHEWQRFRPRVEKAAKVYRLKSYARKVI